MDSFWFWLITGLVVAVLGVGVVLRRVRANNASLFASETTPERAAAASARLSEPAHRLVYQALAKDDLLRAAQEIRVATGQGARDALLDAQSLRRFPQQWKNANEGTAGNPEPHSLPSSSEGATEPAQDIAPESDRPGRDPERPLDATTEPGEVGEDGGRPGLSISGRVSASGGPEASAHPTVSEEPADPGADQVAGQAAGQTAEQGTGAAGADESDWVIPDSWSSDYGSDSGIGERHMEMNYSDGTEHRRFSTHDLPDAERDQLMSQLRDGDMASAAKIIAEKAGLDAEQVEQALLENHRPGSDRLEDISVRLDRGDGTQVEFSSAQLPAQERAEFVSALRAGDLVSAAQVVSRHTGLSPEQALGLLSTIRRRG